MRVEKLRIGTKVFIHNRGGARRPTPPRQAGIIVGIHSHIKCNRRVYYLSISTDSGIVQRDARPVKFSEPPPISPGMKRKIWIRKDIAGTRTHPSGPRGKPPFLWKEPRAEDRSNYRAYDIHISHVADLRTREKTMNEVEKELAELQGDLYSYLRFLKEEGAAPVDTSSHKPKITG